jgi:hypothetical protein
VTFSLSLIAALSAAILTLFRFGDRWLMYRTLKSELINAGWALVNSPYTDLDKPWSAFTVVTNDAISKYDAEYAAEVISVAQPKSSNQSDGQGPRESSAEAAQPNESTAKDA